MSYFIQGSCINCGRCAAVCPVAAPASDGLQYQINKDTCLSCGACAEACHEGAIAMADGKAKLMRDDYCDGLGDCLPTCQPGPSPL